MKYPKYKEKTNLIHKTGKTSWVIVNSYVHDSDWIDYTIDNGEDHHDRRKYKAQIVEEGALEQEFYIEGTLEYDIYSI